MALRARCCAVIGSDTLMDHLLEYFEEFFDNGLLERLREPAPDGFGGDGHNSSHCVASVTNSVTLASVSLVAGCCPGGASEVADQGRCKRMYPR